LAGGAPTGASSDFVAAFEFATEYSATGINLVTKERELPDLQTFSVSAPATAKSGDYIVVYWDVRNPGLDTGNVSWTDRVILSEDAVLDAGDIELGRVLHKEGLPKGETYREAGVYTLPIDAAGDFTIFVTADSDFAVFEGLKEPNNSAHTAAPMHVTLRPVPNLHVATIDVPAAAQPDQRVRLSWTVENLGAGIAIGPWTDQVYLSADGSLTGATLLASVQHDGGMIPGASYKAFADVTLPRVADGAYRIVVSTDATKRVHERFDEGDNVTVSAGTIDFAHADLQVSAVSAPDEEILGYPVQVPVTWTVTNQGLRPTIPGAWQDQVYLSQNAVIGDADDVLVGSFLHNGALLPGESAVQTRTVSLPFGVKGAYNLFVTADGAGHVFEAGQEGNNQSTLEAIDVLTAYADFAVDSVVVPLDGGASGTPVSLSWKVSNVGIHDTLSSSSWSDAVYLSADAILDGGDTLLAKVPRGGVVPVGGSYTGRASPVLPNGIEGPFHIIVVADTGSAVYEDGRRANNQGSQAMEVLPRPAPDLRVEPTIVVPAEGQPDRSVAISWTVTNSGPGNAEGAWVDRVYLSSDGTLSGATLLGEALHDGGLAVGKSYSQTTNFSLPRVGDGNYRIVIKTDAADAIFEGKPASVAENNNLTASASRIEMLHPDLQVPQVNVPDGVIQGFPVRLPISWTVSNDGLRGSLAATWSDQIVLSRNAVLGDGDDQVVGSFTRFGSLAAGESYTRGETLTLPIGVSGDYRIFVRTDASGQVYEGSADDGNNASTPVAVSLLTPFSDLVVDSVTTPDAALGRDTIVVSWTVRNQGEDSTHAETWSERILLSADATLDAGDLEIGRVTHIGDIAPGESYSESGAFTLPERLQGSFHVFVSTDAAAAVYEDGFEGNNVGEATTTLTVTPPPTPNLRVTRVAGPVTGYAGDFARVSWTVTNDGAMPARGGWTDKVYLSVNGLAEGPALASVHHTNALGLHNIYSAFADITLPDVIDGDYRFVVVTDTADEVFEGAAGEADNLRVSDGTVGIVHPDLLVSKLVAPKLATGGDVIAVDWTVKNAGTAAARGNWADKLYLSTDATLDSGDRLLTTQAHTGPLAAGGSYTAHTEVKLPVDLVGPAVYYLISATDRGGQVKEYQAEDNNQRDVTMVVMMAPFADLLTSDVSVNTALTIGDPAPLTVTWTVTNVGIAPGATDQWVDQIVVGDQVVASFTHTGALEVGQHYTRTESILLPAAMQGRFTVSVRSDGLGQVFENAAEANNQASASHTVDVMPVGYADLQVTAMEAKDGFSGKPIQVNWTVANKGISSTSSSEWSDRLVLARNPDGSDVIQTYGDYGHLGVLARDGSYTRYAEITLPEGLSGTVYAVVRTGGPFEFLYTDNNERAAAIVVQLSPSPDLQVADIRATPAVSDGSLIDVTWTVENQGLGTAAGTWSDLLVLQPVGNPAASSITLGYFNYTAPLEAGKHYTRTEQFRLPERITGTYQVVVATNSSRSLYEYGVLADNNVTTDESAVTVSLRPRADLQMAVLDVPEHVTAGGTLSARFEVINQGTTATTVPRWQDRVYLSLDNRPSGDDILIGSFENGAALDAGERYATETGSVVIPIRYRGDVYVIAVADSGDAVDEYPNDGNNVRVETIHVEPRAFGDLVTSNIVAPNRAQQGSQVEVRYTVTNRGSSPTYAGEWHDTIWLTRDKKRPSAANGAILLGSVAHNGALAVNEGYDNTIKVNLPSSLPSGISTFYITVWSDAYDVVIEDTLSSNTNPDDPTEIDNNNYKARAIQVIAEPPPVAEPILVPDLTVTALLADPTGTGGETFHVSWTVENAGGGMAAGGWTDQVYLSKTPVFSLSDPSLISLGAIAHTGPLTAGASYTVDHTFQLQPPAEGTYVIVVTDANRDRSLNGQVDETEEDNNALSSETLVVPRAPADLAVTSVTVPRENFSGEASTVQWTVTNIGAEVWSGTNYWIDQVWLSPDPVFDPRDKFYRDRAIRVGDFAHSNSPALAAGGSYTQTAGVTLPAGIRQSWFAHVYVDLGGQLTGGDFSRQAYEIPSSNYAKQTVPVTYREPDLSISGVLAPAAAMSGQPISVEWTIENIGTRETRQRSWSDRVYLSRDPSLDKGDVYLADVERNGSLATGAAYTGHATVTLPEGIEGSYYLLLAADDGNGVPEFADEGNNLAVRPLTVSLHEPPDLRVTTVSIPEHAMVGQSFSLGYTVSNVSTGATPPLEGTWTDEFYLSRDPFLDFSADRYLGSRAHSGGLASAASYSETVALTLPGDLVGAYYVFVATDPARGSTRGSVFELAHETDNATAGAQPLLIELQPPSDLQVDSIVTGGSVISGDPLHVSWTVSNHGAEPAAGSWTDAVYLSTDAVWDIGDRLLGRVDHNGTLTPTQAYTSSLEARVPPLAEGQYRVIVRTDIYNQVFEGAEEANNRAASPDPLTVSVEELHLGVALNTTLDTGQTRVFRIAVGPDETLRVRLTSPAVDGANEVFLRYGDIPTAVTFDAIYQDPLQADQIAVIPNTKAGTYYVLVRGHQEPAPGTPVRLLAEVVPLAIAGIKQDRGGDSGHVTVNITGARFAPGAVVKLVRPDIAEIEPVRVQVVDSTKIVALFDFSDVPHGQYDLEVINPNGQRVIEPYRYLVERAIEPDVAIGLGGPRVVLAGDIGTYGVAFQSLTNIDTPYVKYEFGIPEMGFNPILFGLPYVALETNLRGAPDGGSKDIPWASLDSEVNSGGRLLAPGYLMDFGAGDFTGLTFNVLTYPGLKEMWEREYPALKETMKSVFPNLDHLLEDDGRGLDEWWNGLRSEVIAKFPEAEEGLMKFDLPAMIKGALQFPSECQRPELFAPFRFHVAAAATAMTREEFVNEQTGEAMKLRDAILADAKAAPALQVLAANPDVWVASYLAALEAGGLLRPVADVPPLREDAKALSLQSVLATVFCLDQRVINTRQPRIWWTSSSNFMSGMGMRREPSLPLQGGTLGSGSV
jgi:hypothetical protein